MLLPMEPTIEEGIRSLVPYAYGLARRLTKTEDEAEDLAQEALARAWEKRAQPRDAGALKGWLRSVVVTTYLSSLRRAGLELRLSVDGDVDVDACADPEAPDPLAEAVAGDEVLAMRNGCFLAMARKLTLEQRLVFSLRAMFGLRCEEIAPYLDCSVGAVKALLHRAVANLGGFFDGHCAWVDPARADCRCEAWIAFAEGRLDNVRKARGRLFDAFPETPAGEGASDEKRRCVLGYYAAMPDRAPDEAWYRAVIASL